MSEPVRPDPHLKDGPVSCSFCRGRAQPRAWIGGRLGGFDREEIVVATFGNAADAGLDERIVGTIREAQDAADGQQCCLVTNDGDCESCATPLSVEEGGKIQVRRDGDAITIARVTCPTAPKFWRWRRVPWPKVVQRDVEFLESAEHIDEWKPQLATAVLCGLFGLAGFALGGTEWSIWAYVLAYLAGSWFTAQEVWERLQKGGIDVHFLMLAVAARQRRHRGLGRRRDAVVPLFVLGGIGTLRAGANAARNSFSVPGRSQSRCRSRRSGRAGRNARRTAARRDAAVIRPDAQFPADAEIVKGQTAADESNLTGEAVPVEKSVGDQVLAGTLNLWGAVEVKVLRRAAESALQKIIRLIQDAPTQKAPTQRFADKFGAWYTYMVLALSAAMFFVWWLVMDCRRSPSRGASKRLLSRMTLLVVASPCALVLSIPSAVLAAIAWGANTACSFGGGGGVKSSLAQPWWAMDKTGTLTTGELRVEGVESFPQAGNKRWRNSVTPLNPFPTIPWPARSHATDVNKVSALPSSITLNLLRVKA